MKKKTIAIGALLLALNSFGQTDTLFYDVNKRENLTLEINEDEYAYVELSDKSIFYVLYRNITAYYRDGSVKEICVKSRRNIIEIEGKCVEKVIVHKPKSNNTN
tara:strand:- start:796 stop:1107 length:312 start_codon:yes stop_codon:yes gene_type:complete